MQGRRGGGWFERRAGRFGVVVWVRFCVVRWVRSYVVLPFCACPLPDRWRKPPAAVRPGRPGGGRRGVEKTSWGKGREECFAREKMRRTSGLTRT